MADTLECQVKVFVDTAPVMEKPAAAQAGIGWQGKHTNLLSREFGSWLFLGRSSPTSSCRQTNRQWTIADLAMPAGRPARPTPWPTPHRIDPTAASRT